MNFRIETATEKDIPAVIELMREFAEYENLSEYLEITEKKLTRAMFGASGFVECLIAFADEKPVAYALFYLNFASFRGQIGIYLEDIYIAENYRRSGFGETMLRRIARRQRKKRGQDGFSGFELECVGNEFLQKTRRESR